MGIDRNKMKKKINNQFFKQINYLKTNRKKKNKTIK